MERLAILGASGYAGTLVAARAREARIPLVLLGRRRETLARIAREGDEVRVADARDRRGLAAALEGAFALASTAGPFLEVGTGPPGAAVDAGVHYVDISAEQAFMRRLEEEYAASATEKARTLLPAFGFDFAVGDFAARLAAEGLEPLDEVVVAYSAEGFVPSAGTRATAGHMLAQPQWAFAGGELVRSRVGATTRSFRFPTGMASAVEWGGAEPLSVPRHTDVRNVRSYIRAPRVAAVAGRAGRFAAPLIRAAGRFGGNPSEERRRKARFAVVAEARGATGGRRVTLTGTDIYGLTALLVVRAAEALRDGEARAVGVVAPAEAFDARPFVERLSPLLELAAVEAI